MQAKEPVAAGREGHNSSNLDVNNEQPTCAICLESYSLQDAAYVKGCDHGYCACCILTWAVHKEDPWCPQCKQPFSFLVCCRQLDGTVTEYAAEESVALLKRARWFLDHLESQGHEERIISAAAAYEGDEDEFDEDPDAVEDYYFSSAAGAARIVIGNRRAGPNGYMRAGRMYARPARQAAPAAASSTKGTARATQALPASNKQSPTTAAECSARAPQAKQPQAATPGRRARRNAKRAAADEGLDV